MKTYLACVLVLLALPLFKGCATNDETHEGSVRSQQTADDAHTDWHWAYIGGCLNPWNTPEDKELMGQHNDLVEYLGQRGIGCGSQGSIGFSFNVRSYEAARAEALIKQALAENPSRWTRIMFDFQRPAMGLPRLEPVDQSLERRHTTSHRVAEP